MTSAPSTGTESSATNGKHPMLSVFTSHWLAMAGFGLVMTGIVIWLFLLTVRLSKGQENPYIGVAMVAAAGVLALGAVLTPIGFFFGRRNLRTKLVVVDKKSVWFRLMMFFLITGAMNVGILATAGTASIHYLESKQFCTTCHVHVPEKAAFSQGPHASVMCVDCHVGNGTMGFVKSKLQGTVQLWHVVTDTVHLPVETAIERDLMIPAAETCEECHWKEQPANATLKLIQRYKEDEANTPETTLLTMNVGGRIQGGIHGAHNGAGIEITFVASDPNRQEIQLVEYRNTQTNERRTYVKRGADATALAEKPRISMQCFDCHNRPAHAFDMPDRALDKALAFGRMSASLPLLKKAALGILQETYKDSADAASKIPGAVAAFYDQHYPEVARARAADVKEAGAVVADIYSRNVFPELAITWGTYPDNGGHPMAGPDKGGHQAAPGCFRCHDNEHVAATGEVITNNCFVCHFPSAVGETKPEILKLLGADRLLRGLEKK